MQKENVNGNNHVDPFAQGNESMTPPEVFRMGEGAPNTQGWKVRVVPNKFPITDIHEVIVHSPDPNKDIEELPTTHVELLLQTYKQRYEFHQKDGHVLIFANHGVMAGPSLTHPHSQLVVIPKQINLDALEREPVNNIVEENTFFTVYCPDFSQWPYEVWIAPKIEKTFFGDIKNEEIKDLAQILQRTIKRLHGCFNHPATQKMRAKAEFAYNYYIYHDINWFVRIIPRWIHRAGFELGTGLSVNMIDPLTASKNLSAKEFSGI
ncbi:MAG: Galactose-1-phosphate uridylyltransferase [Candidatus Gottesmanbacteria bacterium GW2011_GWA1_34_13]|uniref:Galactose-1-phosphate uridylyltransferase n=1 Tax=Candidatus Gottesmanbacteria bacterium GW2011_GWA1_34_13 TaxID=1618434 RepID=A0A0G0AQW6_9BACT|nr:MAG: Galactose-1-phosphate uridylyltransferase [Candidatus Gottesmanbacteria bacterium GW2011_GWA1_34_13]